MTSFMIRIVRLHGSILSPLLLPFDSGKGKITLKKSPSDGLLMIVACKGTLQLK